MPFDGTYIRAEDGTYPIESSAEAVLTLLFQEDNWRITNDAGLFALSDTNDILSGSNWVIYFTNMEVPATCAASTISCTRT